MSRQILAVTIGLALSFLGTAAGGYLLYSLSALSEPQRGALARYAVGPVIALVVGACVGAIAKNRPGPLAALSLLPEALGLLFFRKQSTAHEMILVIVDIFSLLLASTIARLVFRMRLRTEPAT